MTHAHSATSGAHHIGLTVPNIHATCTFFTEALGFHQVGEVADYPAIFVSDGTIMLTLWQTEDPTQANAFDRRKNIGLHHFALQAKDLASLAPKLAARDDVEIEFAPEPLGDTSIRHMMCHIPGGIRLELIQS